MNLAQYITLSFYACCICVNCQAQEPVTFINLTDKTAFVASAITPEKVGSPIWAYKAWAKINPGRSIQLPPGFYYLQHTSDIPIFFGERPASTVGFVPQKKANTYSTHPSKLSNSQIDDMLKQGYRRKIFSLYEKGKFAIKGTGFAATAYEIERVTSKTYSYNSAQTVAREADVFFVRGQVLEYKFDVTGGQNSTYSTSAHAYNAIKINVTLNPKLNVHPLKGPKWSSGKLKGRFVVDVIHPIKISRSNPGEG